ncbi:MAG: cadmium-translocating P-type ATPase [Alphaproteobacteria bacterium]|nr:cadmium-translocating P-type ATPase [Alphaproteobacteria bacterium]
MIEEAAVDGVCAWCGAPVEARGRVFCCQGCEAAAAIVDAAGLDDFWARRQAEAPRPRAPGRGWDRVPTRACADGTEAVTLTIDGLRCSSCVWLTERILERTEGVVEARVSYANGRAQVRWDPQVVDLPALAGRVEALGYRPRPADSAPAMDRDLLLRLGVAAFAALNIMTLSAGVYLGWWAGMEARYAALFRWINLALATPVVTWSAVPFFRGAWQGLKAGFLHMDLPVGLGVALLYGHGLVATLTGHDGYLDSLTMLVALLLAGRMVDQRGRGRAAEAASSLAARAPRSVRRLTGDRVEEVSPEALVPGDVLAVAAGEELGADGVVVRGSGEARMALVTGESEPVAIAAGDEVVAGAVLLSGAVELRVDAAGEDTLLARMAAGLSEAGDRPAEPSPADRLAPWFTGITLSLAALTFGGWSLVGGVGAAIPPTIAVLVVACPCALALSGPLARAAGLGAAARRGLLCRSGDALDRLARVDLIALDKTGTVTGGEPVVVSADDAVLRVAAGIERDSAHPVARAIVAEAARRGVALPLAQDVEETPGVGISGVVDGRRWQLRSGGPGRVTVEGLGDIVLRDQVREDARRTVARLRQAGLPVTLLTGDHPEVARAVAEAVGVDDVVAEARPDAKVAWIRARQAEGHRVLFVGDGLNDGPALAAADASIAMGGGAASSVLVADAVVATAGVGPVAAGVTAARAAADSMRVNLRRSVAYNVLAVLAAVAGLVNPLVAAVLMPLSSGLVLAGSMGVERAVREQERA